MKVKQFVGEDDGEWKSMSDTKTWIIDRICIKHI